MGLNWIDHHARNYDAALGRWMSPDPLAEEYSSWSPYNFVMNSPLRFIDPTGMFIELPTKPGEIEGEVHFDEDTGASYVWDGEGGWHSDMQGVEELDEVAIINESSSEDNINPDLNDVGWFLSTISSAVQQNSEYNSKYFNAKYGTHDLSNLDITRQTRAQMGRYARNAKYGGIIVTVGFGGYDIWQGYNQDGGQFAPNTQAAAARTVGGALGAIGGGKIGGYFGFLICGPPCALAGGIIGAAYGGYQGSKQAEKFVN